MQSSSRPRILILTSTFPRWNEDTTTPFIIQFADQLQRFLFDVHVLAPHYPGAKFKERMGNLTIYRFPYFFPFRWQKLCYNGGTIENLRRNKIKFLFLPFFILSQVMFGFLISIRNRYDLINSHWLVPQGLTGSLIAKTMRIPHVITLHGGDVFSMNGFPMGKIKKNILRHNQYIVANSETTKRQTLNLEPAAQIAIIPMGLDVERYATQKSSLSHPAPGNKPIILFVGRLNPEKGIEYLIKALPVILSQTPIATLDIIGDGQDRSRLEQLVFDLDLGEYVKFRGWIQSNNLPMYYHAADIVVVPSIASQTGWKEAQGIVILEAGVCCKPIVATNTGGIPELIIDHQTGLLVPEKSASAIAEAIIWLISHPEEGKQMGMNAHNAFASRYDWSMVGQSYASLLNKLISR